MARPKKSKPNHATGMYEYKATIGKSFDGKAIRKQLMSFLRAECSTEHPSQFVIDGKTKYGYTSIDGFNRGYQIYMDKTAKALGLPYMTPHELRHSYGTILREQGLDLYSISRLLGHADTSVTEKHYVGNDIEVLKKRLEELKNKDELS